MSQSTINPNDPSEVQSLTIAELNEVAPARLTDPWEGTEISHSIEEARAKAQPHWPESDIEDSQTAQ